MLSGPALQAHQQAPRGEGETEPKKFIHFSPLEREACCSEGGPDEMEDAIAHDGDKAPTILYICTVLP